VLTGATIGLLQPVEGDRDFFGAKLHSTVTNAAAFGAMSATGHIFEGSRWFGSAGTRSLAQSVGLGAVGGGAGGFVSSLSGAAIDGKPLSSGEIASTTASWAAFGGLFGAGDHVLGKVLGKSATESESPSPRQPVDSDVRTGEHDWQQSGALTGRLADGNYIESPQHGYDMYIQLPPGDWPAGAQTPENLWIQDKFSRTIAVSRNPDSSWMITDIDGRVVVRDGEISVAGPDRLIAFGREFNPQSTTFSQMREILSPADASALTPGTFSPEDGLWRPLHDLSDHPDAERLIASVPEHLSLSNDTAASRAATVIREALSRSPEQQKALEMLMEQEQVSWYTMLRAQDPVEALATRVRADVASRQAAGEQLSPAAERLIARPRSVVALKNYLHEIGSADESIVDRLIQSRFAYAHSVKATNEALAPTYSAVADALNQLSAEHNLPTLRVAMSQHGSSDGDYYAGTLRLKRAHVVSGDEDLVHTIAHEFTHHEQVYLILRRRADLWEMLNRGKQIDPETLTTLTGVPRQITEQVLQLRATQPPLTAEQNAFIDRLTEAWERGSQDMPTFSTAADEYRRLARLRGALSRPATRDEQMLDLMQLAFDQRDEVVRYFIGTELGEMPANLQSRLDRVYSDFEAREDPAKREAARLGMLDLVEERMRLLNQERMRSFAAYMSPEQINEWHAFLIGEKVRHLAQSGAEPLTAPEAQHN
jgi:hypothetical protein